MSLLPHERKMVGFLLQHLFYGTVGAAVFGTLLLWLDVAGLRSLLFATSDPLLATALLFFGLFVTFGGVAMAVGIISLAEDRN